MLSRTRYSIDDVSGHHIILVDAGYGNTLPEKITALCTLGCGFHPTDIENRSQHRQWTGSVGEKENHHSTEPP